MISNEQPEVLEQAQPQISRSKRIGRELAVIAGYALLSVVFTFPLILNFGSAAPGRDGEDVWQMVWNLWWVRYALENGQNPFETNLMFYPQGTGLYLHALNALNGFVSLPVQYIAGALGSAANGAVAGYNFIVLLSLTLGGYGGFCLARYLWDDTRAALVAGLAFGFCTYYFAHLLGHLNLISIELIPFFVLFFFKATSFEPRALSRKSNQLTVDSKQFLSIINHQSSIINLVIAVLLLVSITFLELQYVLYLAIFCGLYLSYLALAWLIARIKRRAPEFSLWRAYLNGFLIAAVYALVTLPFTVPMLREALTNPNTVPRRQEREYSADLLAWLFPSPLHPIWGKAMDAAMKPFKATLLEKIVFPGFTVYLLVLTGLIIAASFELRASSRKSKQLPLDSKQSGKSSIINRLPPTGSQSSIIFWGFIAVFFAVFSLGPELHIGGRATGIGLPGGIVYEIPILNITRVPSRYAIMAVLALAMLSAWSLAQIGKKLGGRKKLYSGVVTVALVTLGFELLPAPYQLAYYNVPEFSRELAQDPRRDYAVLDVPLNYGKFQYDTTYLKEQMTHRKPLANGYISRNPQYPPYYGVPVFLEYRDLVGQARPDILPALPPDPAILRYFGVRYIAIRKDLLDGGDEARAFEYTSRLLPGVAPVHDSRDMAVYEVPAGAKADFFYNLVQTGWYPAEKIPTGMARWINGKKGELDFWTATARQIEIEFDAWSFHEARKLEIVLNGRTLTTVDVPLEATRVKVTLDLQSGKNRLELRPTGQAYQPSDLNPASSDNRFLSIGVGEIIVRR